MNEIVSYGYINVPKCQFSSTELFIDESTTYNEWENIGQFLKSLDKYVQFWIGDWVRFGERKYGKTYEKALENTDLAYETLATNKYVAEKVESSLRNENLSFSHHKAVAPLTPTEQKQWLDKAEKENISVREFRKQIQAANKPKTPSLPEDKFDVIYADPPWRYDFAETDNRKIENQYPTMELHEICGLEIPSADNAVLFLWATAPKLREALDVIDSWGFEYKTHAIWNKVKMGMGYWFRGQHELLLVATKGTFSPPPENTRIPSIIEIERTQHSQKPIQFYDWIEQWFPNGKYLELFSRNTRVNWTMWGYNGNK